MEVIVTANFLFRDLQAEEISVLEVFKTKEMLI